MGNWNNEENWASRERLRCIERAMWWRGWVGRRDLVELFGISAAQASGDLQRYQELNPGALSYHTSRKRYEAAEGMVCRLHEPVFEEAVRHFLGAAAGTVRDAVVETADSRISVIALPARRSRRLSLRLHRATMPVRLRRLALDPPSAPSLGPPCLRR